MLPELTGAQFILALIIVGLVIVLSVSSIAEAWAERAKAKAEVLRLSQQPTDQP